MAEQGERFNVQLSSAVNATLGGNGAVAIVVNDQDPATSAYVRVLRSGDDGRSSVFDLSASTTNDLVLGSFDIDTAVYGGPRSSFGVTQVAPAWAVARNDGALGTDALVDVGRIQFTDRKVALDVNGHAGVVAKIIGVVFGAAAIAAHPDYVGIGLQYIDRGMSYADLLQLALDARFGGRASNEAVVNLMYSNVVGVAPGPEALAQYKGLLDSGAYTQGTLGVMAAETSLNINNINLVGLAATGIDYV